MGVGFGLLGWIFVVFLVFFWFGWFFFLEFFVWFFECRDWNFGFTETWKLCFSLLFLCLDIPYPDLALATLRCNHCLISSA